MFDERVGVDSDPFVRSGLLVRSTPPSCAPFVLFRATSGVAHGFFVFESPLRDLHVMPLRCWLAAWR